MKLKYKIKSLKSFIKHKVKKIKLVKRYVRGKKVNKTYGTLDDEQMKYVNAFSRTIYPPSSKKEEIRLDEIIHKWTTERTEKDGYFIEYEDFIDIIKSQTKGRYDGRKFYDLPSKEIIKLLVDLYGESDIYSASNSRDPVTLFKFIVHYMIHKKKYHQAFILETIRKDLINGIFTSKLGYSLIGSNSMTGVKGKYADYTESPMLINQGENSNGL